jgi:hypothetical protein
MWTSVKFGDQQTYGGAKRVKVEAIDEGKDWGSYVLECRRNRGETGREAWVLWLPSATSYGDRWEKLPGRSLSDPHSLQDCKKIAKRLILKAETPKLLEELRTATEKPGWAL